MRLLDRHIFTELIGPFLFGVAAFTSLMFAGKELFKITELVAEYHVPLVKAAELMILHVPSLVVITLPMAMLLAALLGFGRLSSDSEVVALFASGISLYRIALPVIAMSVVVTALSFTLNEIVVPKTNSKHQQMLSDLKGQPMSTDKPHSWFDAENAEMKTIYSVGGYDASTRTLRDVTVTQFRHNKPLALVYGKEAVWQGGNEWSFKDGYWKSLEAPKHGPTAEHTVTVLFQGSQTRNEDINKTPDQLALYQKKYDELSFSELREYIRMRQSEGATVNEDRVRLYQKIALPLASLVFALIGTPLGLRPHRSSSAMGLGLAIVIIFAYWILMHYMTILGNNGAVSPATASFAPTLAGICAGIALIVRAAK